jgi:hypothetical protein
MFPVQIPLVYKERIGTCVVLRYCPKTETLVACPSVNGEPRVQISSFAKGAGANPAPKEIVKHAEKKGVPPPLPNK